MANWVELRKECVGAARDLRDAERFRSALSRAYYAVFAEAARALRVAGVSMPRGWEGPSHGRLVELVTTHLRKWLSAAELGRLCFLVTESYRLRRISDYSPSEQVGSFDADCGLAYMAQSLAMLGRVK